MSGTEAAGAVSDIWAKTLASYKKDLSRKDLLVVEAITSPADVANHIKDLENRTHAGKSGRFADHVHSVTGRLTQFSNVIGAIASSNTEASLVWGCLKLLLTIVHQSSEEYGKICKSILAVSDSFPIIDLVTETFNSSELVCGHVVDFYISVLTFWSKALKFYKRRRIFNILRAWHDFESEFGDLDRDMKRYRKLIEKAAAAVHMNESRTARLEQKSFYHDLLDARQCDQKSDRHRDIVRWLAPVNHEANYFLDDLRSASESCHPGTCTWILDRGEFNKWREEGPDNAITRFLWLTGVPGAGKTVLSSFVINEISNESKSPPILYFFFKQTDNDKNSVLAVTRSLLYQLYSLFPATLSTEIVALRDNSGKERALSEQGLWDLFVKHNKELTNLVIVLDALDECNGVDVLLKRLSSLLQCCRARIFVASRKEENIAQPLASYPQIVICQEDVEADIHSYVSAEVQKIPRFQGKSVQHRMIDALSSGHGGMFLWAYLMVKELKELGTVRQVDDALRSLPRGLEALHEAIITRLNSTLHKAHRELATKILKWIVCAVRPLHLLELQEILRFEIREDRKAGHLLDDDSDDDDLLYSESDIELACGALVMSRNGTLQLIHLSTKEILTRMPLRMGSNDSRLGFYVSTQQENPRMAGLCVSYISTHLNGIDSVSRPDLETASRLKFSRRSHNSTELVTNLPFMDYASISWQAHLVDGKIGLELEDVMSNLQTLLTYDLTIKWIELCMCLRQDMALTLERSCNEVKSWADYPSIPSNSSCHRATGFLSAWSGAVVSVINEYAHVIEKFPSEVHFLDLEKLFSNECSPAPAFLPASYALTQGPNLREPISQIHAIDVRQSRAKVEPCRQLQPDWQNPSNTQRLGFLLYDSTRNVYFSADFPVYNSSEVLRAQDRATGRRLLPVKSAMNASNFPRNNLLHVVAAVLCPAHKYLAVLYGDFSEYFITSLWIIERRLDFQGIRDMRPWARHLYCVESRNFWFLDSCLPLTVGQDGLFYCPNGQIHPERGICRRIPDCFDESAQNERGTNRVTLAFSGDGQTLIRLDPSSGLLEKISWLESSVTGLLHWASLADSERIGSVRMRAISQTARFGICEIQPKDESPTVFLLENEVSQQKLQIQLQSDDDPKFFHFSKDEEYLLLIYLIDYRLTRFSRWAVTNRSFAPQAEFSVFLPGFGYMQMHSTFSPVIGDYVTGPASNICVVEDDTRIILVNENRELYELDLKSITFNVGALSPSRGKKSSHEPYRQTRYQLSSDGHRLVATYVACPQTFDSTRPTLGDEELESLDSNNTRIELRFFEIFGTAEQTQKIELEYLEAELPQNHWHDLDLSPDLSMLRDSCHIFDLQASGYSPMSVPESLLSCLEYGDIPYISHSSCGGYLTAFKQIAGYKCVNFGLFRICHTTSKIEKLATEGLENLVGSIMWAAFHPVLPLLLLTCSSCPPSDIETNSKDIKVVEIDLREPELVPIALLQKEIPNMAPLPRTAEYSDCGSYCFLQTGYVKILMMNSVLVEREQVKMQMPSVWRSEMSYNRRFYELGCRDMNTPMVTLYQAIERPDSDGLRDSVYVRRDPQHTIAVQITAFPNHLANSSIYLLVGENEDDFVRILFLPRGVEGGHAPEIKHLRVTMRQILAEMEEAARAVEPRIDELFQKELEEASSDESTEVESGVSADEDGLQKTDTE